MARSALPRTRSRAAVVVAAVLGLGVPAVGPAAAHPPDDVIVLPGAGGAEGIAAGRGTTFYAGDLSDGDVYRGDLRRRTAELFIDAPAGRVAVGMDTALRHRLLFVAGGATGDAYVYDLRSGETVRTYEFGPADSFVNDVVVTGDGAWFTDSRRGVLYHVPLGRDGELGTGRELTLRGPAADARAQFNLNGITATESGRTLVVAHSGNRSLHTVDPRTGDSRQIEGLDLENLDGVELDGRTLWAVQNRSNRIAEIRLTRDLSSGRVREVVTDEDFDVPTTAVLWKGGLAAVNAQFRTPPDRPDPANPFEVVLVDD